MMKKLLLADDSITIQKVIGIIFATEDYQLLISDNGDEAFNKALDEYPDLVIADISMPGKDGFELCQAIKSEPRLAHTSVLLLPGTFEHFDEARVQTVGADGWLTKPFESQALLDKVAQLLDAEPIRLAAAPPVSVAEPVDVDEVELPVDDRVMGLDNLAALDVTEEDSSEGIWDAVSFEEDDLQGSSELKTDAAELDVVEALTAEDSADEMVVEEEDTGSFASFAEDDVPERPIADETDAEAIGFRHEEPIEEVVDFSAPMDEEPLELDEVVEEVTEIEDDSAELAALEDEVAAQAEPEGSFALEEGSDEALELSEASIVAEEEAVVVEEPVFAAEEPLAETGFVADESAEELPVVEPLGDDLQVPDEEILELAEEDILGEEPLEEVAPAAELTPASFGAESIEEEPVSEPESVPFVEDSWSAEETVAVVEPEPVVEDAEEVLVGGDESIFVEEPELVAESAEEEIFTAPVSEPEPEIALPAGPVGDEGFYEPAEEEIEAPAVVTAVAAATGVAVATADKDVSTVEQVEQQLRELSEDELKKVVAKVAGPTIEKLAGEMLEQVIWEVVPDLAESMIRDEIRKIKQGAE
ncbi:MAG: response regulator [Desulfuromonadaceae bacterium]|nr:response regulator [Desulfuromonadaceae bacterium]